MDFEQSRGVQDGLWSLQRFADTADLTGLLASAVFFALLSAVRQSQDFEETVIGESVRTLLWCSFVATAVVQLWLRHRGRTSVSHTYLSSRTAVVAVQRCVLIVAAAAVYSAVSPTCSWQHPLLLPTPAAQRSCAAPTDPPPAAA
jgi:hypothetical protein